jgi:hypothetical protein
VNRAHVKASQHCPALRVIFEVHVGVRRAREFDTAHQALIVSAGKGERAGNLPILQTDGGAAAVDFTLQPNLAGTIRRRLRAAHRQRHRRLVEIVEHCGEERVQELFVDGDRGFGSRAIGCGAALARGV